MKYLIAFSTMLLCMVTLSSTVLFWSSMPTDLLGKVIAGVTATALEACKYSFFPAGIYYLKKRNAGGAALLMIGVVLLIISVCATAGFLENAYNQQTKYAQQNSVEFKTKQQQLNSLQQQIDSINALIAADTSANYRTRAYEFSKQVKALEEKRDSALAELKATKETAQGNAQSLFSVIGMALHQPAEQVRQGAFISLALIVDICAIASLLALGGLGKKMPTEQSTKQSAQPKNELPNKPTPPPPALKQKQPPLSDLEQQIAKEILAGLYGQPVVSVRGIITGAKVAHPIVAKILENLLSANHVRREGKRYFLIQQVITG